MPKHNLIDCKFCGKPLNFKGDDILTFYKDKETKNKTISVYFLHLCNSKELQSAEFVMPNIIEITSNWNMLQNNAENLPLALEPVCKYCNDKIVVYFYNYTVKISHSCLDDNYKLDLLVNTVYKAKEILSRLNTCYDPMCSEQANKNSYCELHEIPF